MTDPISIPVDPANADMARAWDGGDGEYWARREARFDESLRAHHGPFLDAARIAPGDRVLDVGCGNGRSSLDAARRAPSGSVLGVDLSSRMLEVARRRAAEEGVENVRFEHADAQVHPYDPGAFDVAISRTGAMFFADPVAAFANIGRALGHDGRIALLVWQPADHNEWFREISQAVAAGRDMAGPPPGAPGPFSLGDPERVREILGAAGYAGVELDGRHEHMYFGADADDAYDFVSGLGFVPFMLQDLDAAARQGALDALRASIEAHVTGDGVQYSSATWIVTARRSA